MCEKKKNLILLISGVPGAGKTTISYELLKKWIILESYKKPIFYAK